MRHRLAQHTIWYFFTALALAWCLSAEAAAAEEIQDFEALITIRPDASIAVTETIRYDFGVEERHGIYREIPHRYETGTASYTAAIEHVGVRDAAGAPYPFSVSKGGGKVRIKIGDPDKTVSGVQTYRIQYEVSDVITFFEDYDELYWNVTGNDWQVPVRAVHGSIHFDRGARELLQAACYRGAYGSNEPCDPATIRKGPGTFTFGGSDFTPYEGLSIAIALPKGFVHEPTAWERFMKTVRDNGIVALPLLVALAMWRLWYKRGRDPKGRSTIIAEFDPPKGITPLEAGGLIDENVQPKDITAEIVYLAVQGYLKIHQVEKKKLLIFSGTDYVLEKLKDPSTLAAPYDRSLYEALFASGTMRDHAGASGSIHGVSLSDLAHKLQSDIQEVKKQTYETLAAKSYFRKNPQTVRLAYVTAGVIAILLGVGLAIMIPLFTNPLAIASFVASGVIVIIFAAFMPVKTPEGVAALEHLLGLKRYLSVAEKDRLAFHNSPEHTPERFDALLPYAMVFGVEKEWAKQFEDIYRDGRQPSWYAGPPGYIFAPAAFASDLSEGFASAVTAASAPQGGSGSGGGGFSGGGFGGGGGGSW